MKNLEWKEICDNEDYNFARSCSSACLLKNSLYVFGGCDVDYTEINNFIKFPLPSHHLRGHFSTNNYSLFPRDVRNCVFFLMLVRKCSILKILPKFVLYLIFGLLV